MKAQTANKVQKPKVQSVIKRQADPEKRMLQLAKEGKLAEAGKKAIAESHKAGLSPVVMLGNQLFRLHPDGTKTLFQAPTFNVEIGEVVSLEELKERRHFEGQKHALEQRAERLRRLSLGITDNEGEAMKNVPAYMRRNIFSFLNEEVGLLTSIVLESIKADKE